METFMVCMIIIVSMIVFAISVCKLSSKLELKSQYQRPVPNNLLSATEEEKDLLRYSYTLVGTIYGGKYTKSLVDEWCKSLYVAYGTVIGLRDDATMDADGLISVVRYVTIQIDELQFEVSESPLDDAAFNDKVMVFYSQNDKGQMVYRFASPF
jgi:hypothetical protein